MILPKIYHIPVLLPQVIDGLKIKKGGKYIDATLGGGGYANEILKTGGVVLGLDVDINAIRYAKNKFSIHPDTSGTEFRIDKDIFLVQGNFSEIKEIAKRFDFKNIDGIVFDLGMSGYQIADSGRGFSYQRDEPLDMRMGDSGIQAKDIINKYSKDKLYEIFTKNSEELNSGAIVSAIIRSRALNGPIERTSQLGEIIDETLKREFKGMNDWEYQNIVNRCKARIFQALRIEVNNELNNLKTAVRDAIELLKPGGRLVILSYHSLEDRIVKTELKEKVRNRVINILTKKPLKADEYEQMDNSRSRSAKLRIAEKK